MEDKESLNSDESKQQSDYVRLTKSELVGKLKELLGNNAIQEITSDVEIIRSIFYRKHHLEIEQKKKNFISDGGVEEEFVIPPDPLEEVFKELYGQFRERRSEFSKMQENEKEINLKKKLDIIEQIRNLVNTQESLNKTFNEFRELQRQWREAGPVPQSELHSLWESYHHNVELFYDYIKINKELRDLDLKKNMEAKIKLCEKAEQLLLEPSVLKAFNELQKLHTEWRETGPVAREKREELWERFKQSTNQINKKHQEFYINLKEEQKKNLAAKTELCEKVEEIITRSYKTPKEWNERSAEVINLQKMWRTIGFAPRKENNKIYDRFRKACDEFFNRKRNFFSEHRKKQNANLQLKTDLCVQAEALMNSTEWRKTTEELIVIQKRWKEIGPVPRKYSDNLWKRFRLACDSFFERRGQYLEGQDSDQVLNLKKKEELIDSVKSFTMTGDQSKDLKELMALQKKFTSIGHVPLGKKEEMNRAFREAINQLYDQLDVDETQKEILKFRQKIDNLAGSPKGKARLAAEREKLINKLKQLESDIVLWENNIGFFSKSEKSESLIHEVEHKIESAKNRIKILKQKIDLIEQGE